MGADFGSMLAVVLAFGLLSLLVSGVRLRLWHLLVLGLGGALAVLAVSFLDWLRPPEDRTHLGRFIDELLSGELLGVRSEERRVGKGGRATRSGFDRSGDR